MRELPFTAGQTATDLPQTVCATELTEKHRHELIPRCESARVALGAVLFPLDCLVQSVRFTKR
jgi:hypothetical protein